VRLVSRVGTARAGPRMARGTRCAGQYAGVEGRRGVRPSAADRRWWFNSCSMVANARARKRGTARLWAPLAGYSGCIRRGHARSRTGKLYMAGGFCGAKLSRRRREHGTDPSFRGNARPASGIPTAGPRAS
jgi:hypothetical protein